MTLFDRGYRVQALWIVSGNKIKAASTAQKAAKRMSNPFVPVHVFNDRDGSNARPAGFPVDVVLENLHPGLMVLVYTYGLSNIIQNGIPEHDHSANLIRAYIWRFVSQLGVRTIFGEELIERLRAALEVETLNISPYQLTRANDDRAMLKLAKKAEFHRVVMHHYDNPAAAIEAISKYYNLS